MLPILRTISVGGVLLALMLLMLALNAPDDSRAQFVRPAAPARGAMIDRRAHPEWRQLLMLAAFRRAEALQALRARPDRPAQPKPQPDNEVAALPGDHSAAAPDVTIPVDIGEASSTELPVLPHEELPPVVTPQLEPRDSSAPAEQPALRKAVRRENPFPASKGHGAPAPKAASSAAKN